MHQVADASLNVRFTHANFTLAPEDPRSSNVLEVRGSFLTAAYVVFKTLLDGAVALVRVAYSGERSYMAHVTATDVATDDMLLDVWVGVEDGMLTGGSHTLRTN